MAQRARHAAAAAPSPPVVLCRCAQRPPGLLPTAPPPQTLPGWPLRHFALPVPWALLDLLPAMVQWRSRGELAAAAWPSARTSPLAAREPVRRPDGARPAGPSLMAARRWRVLRQDVTGAAAGLRPSISAMKGGWGKGTIVGRAEAGRGGRGGRLKTGDECLRGAGCLRGEHHHSPAVRGAADEG